MSPTQRYEKVGNKVLRQACDLSVFCPPDLVTTGFKGSVFVCWVRDTLMTHYARGNALCFACYITELHLRTTTLNINVFFWEGTKF